MPQWNCACPNCQSARSGAIPSLTQSSIAISGDDSHWFLVNASPDIRAQLTAFPPLHPASTSPRNNPLEAILLTNADLDHVAGLLFLREGEPLHLHASKAVRQSLTSALAFTSLLDSFCGIIWHEPSTEEWSPLSLRTGEPSGLLYRALPLRSPPPIFNPSISDDEPTSAFLFKDERTGGVLLMAPDVFEINGALLDAVQNSDAVLFDGTFWTDHELGEVKESARNAADMGHLPILNGSLPVLSPIPTRHKIYLHINNTNPILAPDSMERQVVESAGITIGYDGLEIEL